MPSGYGTFFLSLLFYYSSLPSLSLGVFDEFFDCFLNAHIISTMPLITKSASNIDRSRGHEFIISDGFFEMMIIDIVVIVYVKNKKKTHVVNGIVSQFSNMFCSLVSGIFQ